MSVKIEDAGLDLTASFQYSGETSILSGTWVREKSGVKEVETFHMGTLEC